MIQTNNAATQPIDPRSLSIRMAVGAAIGLALISLLIFPVNHPRPEWGEYWRIRPLLVVPFAGAMGGLCNYLLLHFHQRFGVNKTVAIITSIVIGIFGLWMGIVLGLVGTLWH
ncbi:MAG: potassium transporter KefB [Spirosomataceae bacterium]